MLKIYKLHKVYYGEVKIGWFNKKVKSVWDTSNYSWIIANNKDEAIEKYKEQIGIQKIGSYIYFWTNEGRYTSELQKVDVICEESERMSIKDLMQWLSADDFMLYFNDRNVSNQEIIKNGK